MKAVADRSDDWSKRIENLGPVITLETMLVGVVCPAAWAFGNARKLKRVILLAWRKGNRQCPRMSQYVLGIGD